MAARLLGAKLASFVGLTEVLFAVLFAWLLLGQLPGGQLLGGLFIIAGVALVHSTNCAPTNCAGRGAITHDVPRTGGARPVLRPGRFRWSVPQPDRSG